MDVPPCNPLFDLWFVAMVLSKTLNGSSEYKVIERPVNFDRPFLFTFLIPNSISSQVQTDSFIEDFKGNRYEKIIYCRA